MTFFLFWVFAWVTLVPLAYFIRDWRTLMLVVTAPSVAGVVLFWVLDESPKWLHVAGKKERAEEIVRKIAKRNGREQALEDGLD